MTARGGLDAAGLPDVDQMRCSDELLDRLGDRRPGPADLDDPVSATLAVLAGEVDLSPIPVSASRRALAARGLWPLPPCTSPADGGYVAVAPTVHLPRPAPLPPGADASAAARSLDELPSLRPAPSLPPNQAVPPHSGGPAPSPPQALEDAGPEAVRARYRRAGRPGGAPERTRAVRVRASMGLVAAAVLGVVGGGAVLSVVSGELNPLTGVQSVVDRWAGHEGTQDVRALLRQVQAAHDALARGDRARAQRLLAEVNGKLGGLAEQDRRVVAGQVTDVERELASTPADAIPTDVTPGASGATGSVTVSGGGSAGNRSPDAGGTPVSGSAGEDATATVTGWRADTGGTGDSTGDRAGSDRTQPPGQEKKEDAGTGDGNARGNGSANGNANGKGDAGDRGEGRGRPPGNGNGNSGGNGNGNSGGNGRGDGNGRTS